MSTDNDELKMLQLFISVLQKLSLSISCNKSKVVFHFEIKEKKFRKKFSKVAKSKRRKEKEKENLISKIDNK